MAAATTGAGQALSMHSTRSDVRHCLHRQPSTFARLADGLGFVRKDDIFHVLKAILAAQRDYGRRDDRKQARLKYLVQEWGIDKFRTVVEQYFGKRIEPLR